VSADRPHDDPADEIGEDPEDLLARFRAASGGVTARFGRAQAAIVRDLVSQVAELIGGEGGTAGAGGRAPGEAGGDTLDADRLAAQLGFTDAKGPPEDPVLARLLPDAYSDDPEAAGEFRRYTEHSLRSAKVAAALTVLATLPPSGGRVRLSGEQAEAWLRSLNDVRLALGVRLGITEDDQQAPEVSRGEARSGYKAVYHWLSYLQETLVEALSAGSGASG
jgi:hypothetical protein